MNWYDNDSQFRDSVNSKTKEQTASQRGPLIHVRKGSTAANVSPKRSKKWRRSFAWLGLPGRAHQIGILKITKRFVSIQHWRKATPDHLS